jgi:hypothetical protein
MKTFALTLILAAVALPASVSNRIIPKNPILPAEPTYDTATVVDVMGKIIDVWEIAPHMPLQGVHLAVRSGSENLDVYVGPADFVKIFGVTFTKGDRIEVIGSRVMNGDDDIVLAAEIHIYDVTITLRDKNGTPYWKDWSRRTTGK